MDVVFTHYAGLDVHKKTAMVCRVTPDPIGQQAHGLMGVQEFGTLPCDLRALSNLLVEGQADTPVMAELAQGWMRSKIPGSEQALTGLVRGHYPELLARQLAHIDFLDEHNDTLSVATTPCLLELAAGEPPMVPMAMAGMAEGGAAPNPSPPPLLDFTQAVRVLGTISAAERVPDSPTERENARVDPIARRPA